MLRADMSGPYRVMTGAPYELLSIVFLFFSYSFLGWVGEVLFTAVVHRKYQDAAC